MHEPLEQVQNEVSGYTTLLARDQLVRIWYSKSESRLLAHLSPFEALTRPPILQPGSDWQRLRLTCRFPEHFNFSRLRARTYLHLGARFCSVDCYSGPSWR